MKHGLKLSTNPKTVIYQILRTRLSNIVKLSERDFNQLINDIESNPLFEKIRNEKIVKYKRFPKTGFSFNFLGLNEDISADYTPIDVEPILKTKQETIKIIKKIGIEKFKKYFLYNEGNTPNNELTQKCGISIDEVKKIVDLLNEMAIRSEFYNPSGIDIALQVRYNKIASIEKSDKDGFVINFFSPNSARGKYEIDYEKLVGVKDRKIKSFIRKIELINTRKAVIYQVLEKLLYCQERFLNTGSLEERRLLTQKELAKEISVDPSVVCRVLSNKSVQIPSGKEIPLKTFFLNEKDIKRNLVKKIIRKNEKKLSAEKIKQILKEKHGINISRRSVAYYLSELNSERPK